MGEPRPRRTPNPILLTSRPRSERIVWAIGLVLLLGGQLLGWTVSHRAGTVLMLPGAVITVVIVFRALLYRRED